MLRQQLRQLGGDLVPDSEVVRQSRRGIGPGQETALRIDQRVGSVDVAATHVALARHTSMLAHGARLVGAAVSRALRLIAERRARRRRDELDAPHHRSALVPA